MSPALIPLIGPVINGVFEFINSPKEFTAETIKTKTTKAAAVAAVTAVPVIDLAQTEDQAIISFIYGVVSLALFFYKKAAK